MGAQIGFFSDSAPVDYPELNKCPDCETFFQDERCPLCGKLCPEEMRAGNRKPVKQKKRSSRSDGRVRFVPWYFSAWFIVAMLMLMPIVGLILLWQSDMRKGWKIALTFLPIAPTLLSGLMMLLNGWLHPSLPDASRDEPETAWVAEASVADAEILQVYCEEIQDTDGINT